jgi:hypothetical protein
MIARVLADALRNKKKRRPGVVRAAMGAVRGARLCDGIDMVLGKVTSVLGSRF